MSKLGEDKKKQFKNTVNWTMHKLRRFYRQRLRRFYRQRLRSFYRQRLRRFYHQRLRRFYRQRLRQTEKALRPLRKRLLPGTPMAAFHADHYLRHDARRLEHLASLRIPVAGSSVLEVGAGIGDLSHYYIDRGCQITITEAREENLHHLRRRYPRQQVEHLDMEHPRPIAGGPFDVIHCYGLLYHLKTPKEALDFLAENCNRLLLLETCVSFGDEESINLVSEHARNPTQAISGTGCRPTRPWLFSRLQEQFEYVYIPKTQPHDIMFPLDWTAPEKHKGLSRAIFIASRDALDNEMLTTELLDHQIRHE